jgi:Cu/Ag efflux protein CusF
MEKTKMRKILVPAAATALCAAMSIANAADATGVIKSIDTAKDTITLADGATYWAPATMKLSTFKVGQKVAITYSQSNGKMEVSAMKPAA